MKNFIIIFIFLAFYITAFSQEIRPTDHNQKCISVISRTKTDLLNNDLAIIKPLINTNDSNGGYYSEYYYSALKYMYCGAIIRNIGTNIATNVNMELAIRDGFYNNILETYYSDTISILNPGEVDTLNIPGEMTFGDWIYANYYSRFVFDVRSDSLDENPSNNNDTIPFPLLSDWMWTTVSRSIYLTNSKDISQIGNFQSGDFLGFTLSIPEGYHWLAYLKVYLPEVWPDSSTMIAKIFRNGALVDTAVVYLPNPPQAGWVFSDMFWYGGSIDLDSLYYIGVEMNFKPGTSIMIGADTSSYHNFPVEAIARIGNSWTTLDFVPLIQLICDPEGIKENDHISGARVYPNPTSGTVFLDHVGNSEIELFNLAGVSLFTDNNTAPIRTIDITFLPAGVYILRILNGRESISRRIVVVK